MSSLTFREFLQIGQPEWQVQRRLLIQHYLRNYRPPLQPGRKQWVVERNLLLRHYVRGPLGIHRRIRQARLLNAILRLKLPHDASILDAGCGHAYAMLWLAQNNPRYRITGLELDPELIAGARRTASAMDLTNLELIQADLSALTDTATYDLVVSMDVLEHIEDDVGALRAFRRALRRRGQMILHLPRRHQEHRRILPVFKDHTTPDHVRDEYTAAEIRARLDLAGFQVEYLRYGFSLWGELAFELNNLFWQHLPLRLLTAVALHPLCVWLAYMDTRQDYDDGNSLLVLARPRQTSSSASPGNEDDGSVESPAFADERPDQLRS